MNYHNYYLHCGIKWDDCWDRICDDECSVCGEDIPPYKSDPYNLDDLKEEK